MQAQQADQLRNLVALTIEKHGIRAPSFAQHQALKARSDGDLARAATWDEVAQLAEGALREGPEG
jgi:hypothetical protein